MAATPMIAASVHKQMHKRTSQQWQPNEETKDMRPMLGEQQNAGYEKETKEHQSGFDILRRAAGRVITMARMILDRHKANSNFAFN